MTNKEAVRILIHLWTKNSLSIAETIAIEKAIKALEAQPCEDCISRKVVKEQMIKYGFKAPDMTVTEFVEDCLQSVTPKPKSKWTSTKEGLPEKDGTYVVQYSSKFDDYMETVEFETRTGEFSIFPDEVVAWMPLPQPYKAESEENET